MKNRPLTCIDLFAGCGGLSLGLEQAGFETLAYCEINEDAAASYEVNRKGKDFAAFRDVGKMTKKELERLLEEWKGKGVEEVDLVCGGPPCQGYSGIGHRRSYGVDRGEMPSNHLYKEMIRVIKTVKPRAFLFENVRGLMSGRWTASGKKGEIWEEVLAAFEALHEYDVRHALVQAKEYGVPQNRPRVLIVGISKKLGWRPAAGLVADGLLPEPNGTPPTLAQLLGDIVDDRYPEVDETVTYPRAATTAAQKDLRRSRDGEVSPKGSKLTEHLYSKHAPRIREKFQAMHDNGGKIPARFKTKKFAQRLLRPDWGPEGPNITATSLADDFVHYSQARSLTVREWARLQTFPDWYEFRGPRTTGGTRRAGIPTEGIWQRDVPRYTQIGNAVPVWLARAIGAHLAKLLKR